MVKVIYGHSGFIWFLRPDLQIMPVGYIKDCCTIAEIESYLAKVRAL